LRLPIWYTFADANRARQDLKSATAHVLSVYAPRKGDELATQITEVEKASDGPTTRIRVASNTDYRG
jgi:hypothetical protein